MILELAVKMRGVCNSVIFGADHKSGVPCPRDIQLPAPSSRQVKGGPLDDDPLASLLELDVEHDCSDNGTAMVPQPERAERSEKGSNAAVKG